MTASTVVHSGNDGVAKIGGTALKKVLRFEVTQEEASADRVDGMGDDWEDTQINKKRWSGSIECRRLQSDAAGPVALDVGDTIGLALYPDGDTIGHSELSGSARVTSITDGADQDASNRMTVAFIGKGALTRGTRRG